MTESEQFLNSKSPFEKFNEWYGEAQSTDLKHPDAFTLSTVENDQPRSRVVLLKEVRTNGFVFYSNYESHKGVQIKNNPRVSANFYWDSLWRQVIWVGSVEKISYEESQKYWAMRPRQSQISQLVSAQSQPAPTRAEMERLHKATEQKLAGQDIPCPKNWGGYLLKPTYVEFWIGRNDRFHDRFCYAKVENRWNGQRLYP